jgi:hypothetical protein
MELKVEIESPDEFELVLDLIGKASCSDDEADSVFWNFLESKTYADGKY